MCNNSNEEPPKSRFFSVKETEEFEDDIYIDDQLKLSEDNYIEKYYAWITYRVSKDNEKEFHVNDLKKLKDLISKALAGDM